MNLAKIIVVCLILFVVSTIARAEDTQAAEQKLPASYLYNYNFGIASPEVIIIKATSKEATSDEYSFKNLIIGDGLSYNYGHGLGLLAEFRLTNNPLRRLGFRIENQNGEILLGTEFIYFPKIDEHVNWWGYRGLLFNATRDLQYYGVILGVQAGWGGYVEIAPMVSRSDSRFCVRTGVKSDGRIIVFLWYLLYSLMPLGH
jgi:hypothetical protein